MTRNIACLPVCCNILNISSIVNIRRVLTSAKNIPPYLASKYIASAPIFLHTVVMVRLCLNLLALFAIIIAAGLMWQDFVSDEPSVLLGQIWFEISPQSLQVSEAIIERYIDPCGLIPALGCSPFLWHPIIATILGWPAALVMIGLSIIFWWVGGLFGRNVTRSKKATRSLKRQGEK